MSVSVSAAVRAIARYAHEVAELPPIDESLLVVPFRTPREFVATYPAALGSNRDIAFAPLASGRPTVLKAIATDKIAGEVLPRGEDTWLALLPFGDLTRKASEEVKRGRMRSRRGFLEILAMVARAPPGSPLRLDAGSILCVVEPNSPTRPFWLDLARKLDPEWKEDESREMQRCLIALARTQSLRFLFCVTHETVPSDLAEMLGLILEPLSDAATTKSVNRVLAKCGVAIESGSSVVIEIGISFTRAKVSSVFLTKLLDVLDRFVYLNASPSGVAFRVTTLRFGRSCMFQPKALELLGERKLPSSIVNIRLGDLYSMRPASIRVGLGGILQRVKRLSLSSIDGFKIFMSTLRNQDSCVEELDITCPPTAESAAWLAFSLFHVDSKSRVSSLRLRVAHVKRNTLGRFTQEWLIAFRRALQSVTADHELASVERNEQEVQDAGAVRRMVAVKVETSVRVEPYANAKMQCKIVNASEELEAIATIGDSTAVIVPGLGVGWVPNTSITREKTVVSRLARTSEDFQTNGRITSLSLEAVTGDPFRPHEDEHVKALFALVRLVGMPLRHLHLPSLSLTTQELASILAWCPNLTELNVSGHMMTSIKPLVDAYATGDCKIESLSIVRTGSIVSQDAVPRQITEILSEPQGARLRRLAVHLTPLYRANGTTSRQHLNATMDLARALCQSQTLEFVQLPGSFLWESTECNLARQLNDDGEPVRVEPVRIPIDILPDQVCVSKLSTRHKLAFLSCVYQGQDTSSGLRRLDACVLAQIFRFSCHTVARQVIVAAPIVLSPSESG